MDLGFVSRWTSIPRQRLTAIEQDVDEASFDELERLAQLYGVDSERLEQQPIKLSHADGIALLTRTDEFRAIGDATRARIIATANAARDLVELEDLVGEPNRWEQFSRNTPRLTLKRPQPTDPPFRVGAQLASALRKRVGLEREPIPSVLRFVEDTFPLIAILHARLTPAGPAGLAFVDKFRGPTIVLNVEGKNSNPCVRRVSLAHELCHVLADWTRKTPLATISGFVSDSEFETEQRANAFAIRLLCPEAKVDTFRESERQEVLSGLAPFGLPYAAIRLYVRNQGGVDLGRQESPRDISWLRYDEWDTREAHGLDTFPIAEVPLERRGRVARCAAVAYAGEKLTRSAFAAFLGVSPIHEVEQVVDYYGLDVPRGA